MEMVGSVRHCRCDLPTSSSHVFFFSAGPSIIEESYPVSFIVQLCYIACWMCQNSMCHTYSIRSVSPQKHKVKPKIRVTNALVDSHKHSQDTQGSLNDPKGNFKRFSFNKYHTFFKKIMRLVVLNYKIRSKQNNHRW